MKKLRTLGVATIAAGLVLAGAGIASAAANGTDPAPTTGTGSASAITPLITQLATGSANLLGSSDPGTTTTTQAASK